MLCNVYSVGTSLAADALLENVALQECKVSLKNALR